jgi:acetyltransferase-like isoleucine patch superfamily enzyme/glycosyltransferase involved in cell wall biosynthesis
MTANSTTHDKSALEAPPTPPVAVSVIVIGRNEGERLRRCLASVRGADWGHLAHDIIYVDSGSTDDSLATARQAGAACLSLNDGSPCAAKARNLGWRHAQGEFILFLDGDTRLAPGFVRVAMDALNNDDALCAAWGHRRESDPGQSVYTKVLDLDWVYPVGPALYFGGDVLVRRCALAQVGGFDPSLKAGEEPELCARLRSHHWRIEHLDVPMTDHDLAVRSIRAYALRCYRSGIAYAEVAHRMKRMGDGLWQKEAARDFRHGVLYALSPLVLAIAFLVHGTAGMALLALAALVVLRSAWQCRWKAPGRPLLWLQYAIHSHAQKLPALAGQLAWRRAQASRSEIALVEYKDEAAPQVRSSVLKKVLVAALSPAAWLSQNVASPWVRLWSFARLQAAIGQGLHPSSVVLGKVAVHGTGRVTIGREALIYPGVYLETQGTGSIEIGNRVVLSSGVHIVAFERVVLEDGCMVGEYSSIRDANHRASDISMRDSGYESAAIRIGRNVWIGRGVAVLKGANIGSHSIVGANAVVTRPLQEHSRAAGVPARALFGKSVPHHTTI